MRISMVRFVVNGNLLYSYRQIIFHHVAMFRIYRVESLVLIKGWRGPVFLSFFLLGLFSGVSVG